MAAMLMLWALIGCSSSDHDNNESDHSAIEDDDSEQEGPSIGASMFGMASTGGGGVLQNAINDVKGLLIRVSNKPVIAQSAVDLSLDIPIWIVIGDAAVKEGVFSAQEITDLPQEGFKIRTIKKDGVLIYGIAGSDELGCQWGLYELLERMGFRFFHPESSYIPNADDLILPDSLDVTDQPILKRRGFHMHTMHPLPMIDILLSGQEQNMPYARRFVDWLVRNKANYFQWELLRTVRWEEFAPHALEVVEYAHSRGIKVGIAVSYVFSQQKSWKLVPRPWELCEADLRANLDRLMEVPWDHINIEMGASEFIPANDIRTVDWMNITCDHLGKHYPGTDASVKVHCSTDQWSETYNVNFNFIVAFADPRMGMLPHTVMFFDLTEPADAYGNKDFLFMLDFLKSQIGKRPVYYYPETAYWCSFDIDVPLFLPLYVYTRWLDAKTVADAGADGIITFSSGDDFGYWFSDWAVAKFNWNPSMNWTDALDQFAAVFGQTMSNRVTELLKSVITYQKEKLMDKDLIGYISGEDTLDELGWLFGIYTQPKPILFKEIDRMNADELASFEKNELADLDDIRNEFLDFADSAEELAAQAPAKSKFWLDELADDLQINYYRADHSWLLYSGAVERKAAELGIPGYSQEKANEYFEEARQITPNAIKVIQSRLESGYYPGKWRFAEDKNITSYPFRYLWMAYTGYYFTRREHQVINRNWNPFLDNIHHLLQEIL